MKHKKILAQRWWRKWQKDL